VDQVPAEIRSAVAALSEKSGHDFRVTDAPVEGTSLYVVYATAHPMPAHYTAETAMLGFRVPSNYPDACPEDSFFIQPITIKLKTADEKRNSTDIHRASVTDSFLKGSGLENAAVLLFSWHLWDRAPWDRRKHTLFDHYTHSIRRFEQPEHD